MASARGWLDHDRALLHQAAREVDVMLRQQLPTDIPLLGLLHRDAALALPHRHLGRWQADEVTDLDVRWLARHRGRLVQIGACLAMNTPTLMVQGTTSDAGKSLLVTALGRWLKRRGVRVVPFKPQNMALNSAVTADGGEIGRAQAVQAQACGLPPHVDMNPILLKPNSDIGAQVIVSGRAIGNMNAVGYQDYKRIARAAVLDAYQRLGEQYQVILVEGAGSPAEINLRARDIANMGFAEAVDCPLRLHPGVDLRFIGAGDVIPPADLILLPGSKAVAADLAWLRSQGWAEAIARHLRYGGKLIGVCGGFQMLGRAIHDPLGLEGKPGTTTGLGWLDLETSLAAEKRLTNNRGHLTLALSASEAAVTGYEIHSGVSSGPALTRPAMQLSGGPDGAVSADGQILGTYLHGLFEQPHACDALLAWAGLDRPQSRDYAALREADIERLADAVETHLDTATLGRLLGLAPL